MTRRKITIEIKGRIIILRGWQVFGLARGAGCKPTYLGTVGGWALDATRLPDILAYCDLRNIATEVTGMPVTSVSAATATDNLPAEVIGLW
ncbi:hypothetical protein NOCA2140029 [metagenome]|uniref:Uncharacterized protein n=1 Tax=metagenome TaxID=256318 RepID=A0A2P2BWS7_9ZZZZ